MVSNRIHGAEKHSFFVPADHTLMRFSPDTFRRSLHRLRRLSVRKYQVYCSLKTYTAYQYCIVKNIPLACTVIPSEWLNFFKITVLMIYN
jgi:hypothetical protein